MSTIIIVLASIIGAFFYFNIGYWGWKSYCRAGDKDLSERLNFFEAFLIGPEGYWSDSLRDPVDIFPIIYPRNEGAFKRLSIFMWPIHLSVSILSWFVWVSFFGNLFRVLFKPKEN